MPSEGEVEEGSGVAVAVAGIAGVGSVLVTGFMSSSEGSGVEGTGDEGGAKEEGGGEEGEGGRTSLRDNPLAILDPPQIPFVQVTHRVQIEQRQ